MEQKALRLPLAIAIAGLLTGCQTLQEIDDAAGELARALKETPGVTASRDAQRVEAADAGDDLTLVTSTDHTTYCRQKIDDRIVIDGVDVDTAYVRLKRFYGYKTIEEKKKVAPMGGKWGFDRGYLYDALPGVSYAMRDSVKVQLGPTVQQGWMGMRVEREGSGSSVGIEYCIGGIDGFAGRAGFRDYMLSTVHDVAWGKR